MTEHHHLVSLVLHLLAGGFCGLVSASLAGHFGWRAADRLPGEGRWPQCVYCLRDLDWYEAFPLFGWLMRARAFLLPCPCGARTNVWPQPAIEFCGFILGVAAMYLTGWTWMSLPLILGLGILPAIALIDLFFGVIPDGLNLLMAITGIVWIIMSGSDIYGVLITAGTMLALGLFLALIYSRIRGREMLGLGDVKFFAAAGLWLQPEMAAWFLAGAGIIGVIFSLAWRKAGGGRELPFAPALCVALAACVFYSLVHMP